MGPNQSVELTATRRAPTLSMTNPLSLRATLALGGGSSLQSRWTHAPRRFLAVLIASVMCFHALRWPRGSYRRPMPITPGLRRFRQGAAFRAHEAPDASTVSRSENPLCRRSDSPVHNVKVISRTHDSSAERIVANTLAAITFPPIPIDAQLKSEQAISSSTRR